MNNLHQKQPPAPITAANSDWPYKPAFLTDEVLTALRGKVYYRKEVAQKPIDMIVSALSFMSASMQQHMPMVGNSFSSTVAELGRVVNDLHLNEFSSLDYLSGKGPLGSYIADHIEMYKLCAGVHRLDGEIVQHSRAKVDMEYEYNHIFNYDPKPISVNGFVCEEYDYLMRLVKRVHEFGYITQPHNNEAFKELFSDKTLNMDSSEFIFNYGTVEKSGIYKRSNGFGSTRCIMVLVAPIRDTEVALVFDLYNQGSSLQRLYYKHRAENIWVKASDASGSWYLEGTYAALSKEAESFLAKMDCQLEPTLRPHSDNCLTDLKRISVVVNALAEMGCANSITDVFKEFVLGNKDTGSFSLKLNGVTYTYGKMLGEKPEYRINIEKVLSSSSFRDQNFHDTIIYGEEVKTNLPDSFTTTCYLVQELEKYLDKSMAKLEELYNMTFAKPAEEE